MRLFKTIGHLQAFLKQAKTKGARIGFVPTMGALHEGHLELIRRAASENDLTVCSIYVNPTQFNELSDLEKYPRTPEKDIFLLREVGSLAVFFPTDAEIYPEGPTKAPLVGLGHLNEIQEARFRPGHFDGVVQVVARLLNLVQPDLLYMGQKDYQQVLVIRRLLEQQSLSTQLVVCPIVREKDGLAMSSRNVRLDPGYRQKASFIYECLQEAAALLAQKPIATIQQNALDKLTAAGFRPEYFEIAAHDTLLPLASVQTGTTAIITTAVWAGEVRLIDNCLAPINF